MFTTISATMREIESFDSCGAPVLSLYLPTAASDGVDTMTRATRLVRALAADLPEATQADIANELDMARDYLGSMIAPPPGLAIFCCGRRRFFRVVRLPVAVEPAAWWQPDAQTRPLHEAADRAFGVLATAEPVSCP